MYQTYQRVEDQTEEKYQGIGSFIHNQKSKYQLSCQNSRLVIFLSPTNVPNKEVKIQALVKARINMSFGLVDSSYELLVQITPRFLLLLSLKMLL